MRGEFAEHNERSVRPRIVDNKDVDLKVDFLPPYTQFPSTRTAERWSPYHTQIECMTAKGTKNRNETKGEK